MMYANPRKYDDISRYSIYRLIIDDNETYTETVNQTPIDITDKDKYHQVQPEEENRLDIIANNYYGQPQYAWIIAMGNGIIDPLVIKPGTILRIPDLYTLYQYDNPLYQRV